MNVPAYQPFQVQNNPTQGGMMSPDATSAAFGGEAAREEGEVAKGLGDVGQAGMSIAMDKQRQVNNDKVRMALSAYGQKMDEKVQGDFLNRHGESAINMLPEAKQYHDDLRQDTIDSLDNDYQKRVFSELEADRRYSSLKTVAAHQAKQQYIFHQHSLLADNDSAQKMGLANPDDDKVLSKSAAIISQNTLHLYQDDPEADMRAQGAVSHMYETIAKTKAETMSGIQALAFLDKYKDKIEDVPRAALQQKFEEKAISEAANAKSQIIATTPGITLDSAQKLIDEQIKNPKEAELTMANVKSRLAVNEKVAKDAQQQQTEGAWKSFIQDPKQDIDPNLPHEEQLKMADYREKMTKQVTQAQSDNLYGKLLNMPDSDFISYNLNPHANELGSHFNFLLERQQKMRGGGKEGVEFEKALGDAKSAAAALPMFKISEKDSQDVAQQKETQLHQYLADFSNAYKQLPSDKQTRWDTVGKIQDELLKQNVINTTHNWVFADKFKYQGQTSNAPLQWQPNANDVRADGSEKGTGFLGVLKRPDGNVSSELSVGVEIDGKQMDIPTLVPTLNKGEIDTLLNLPKGQLPPQSIIDKAAAFAKSRIAQGMSPFADNSESPGAAAPSPNSFVNPPSTSDQLLRSKLGIQPGVTVTGDDFKQSAKQMWEDLKTSGRAVASLPGKAWSAVANPIGGAVGQSFANAMPTQTEMKYANDLHVLLQSSGVDTSEADNAFKKMNGVSVADANSPGGQTLGGSNTPRMYINEVNKLADQHANEIAKQLNLQRVRHIKEMNAVQSGEMFVYNGKILIKK